MRKREFKNIEWSIGIIAIILCIIGLVALFSSTQEAQYDEFNKQCIWLVVSIVIAVIVMMIDYETITKISPICYGNFIILLIIVLFTPPVNGATSWFDIGFFSLQPGEFAKIFVVLCLAYAITKIQEKDKKSINKPIKLLMILAIVVVPVLLIIKQPDYGTAAAFIVATVLMLITAGIDKKYIISTIILVVISVPLIYHFILPEHAKKRIDIFLNPESDPRGSGYNIIQSKLAIRSRRTNRDGIIKRKSDTIRIFISKDNRLYICCYWRRNGIYCSWYRYYIICVAHYKVLICSKNSKRPNRLSNCFWNKWDIYLPYVRKYRNGNGIIANNRSTSSLYQLWRKFFNY